MSTPEARAKHAAYMREWTARHRGRLNAENRARYRRDPGRYLRANAAWRKANPEKRRVSHASYYRAHIDEARQQTAVWRAAHPDKVREYSRRWFEEHREQQYAAVRIRRALEPERHSGYSAKDRARRKNAPLCEHPACLIVGVYALVWQTSPHRCYMCDTPVFRRGNLHMDHVIPLIRGGIHCAENVRPSCGPCNIRKSDRMVAA